MCSKDVVHTPINSGVVNLNQENFDTILASNELVFITFYAEWCRFSNILMPILDETADKLKQDFPDLGRVVMGKVDCDKEPKLGSKFQITKYPTLKFFQKGPPVKRVHRGPRSVEAFVEFVKMQLGDPIKEFHSLAELESFESNKSMIIGYFDRRDQPEYNIFRRVATNLKEDFQFLVGFGEAFTQKRQTGQPTIVFRPNKDRYKELDITYNRSINNLEEIHIWISEICMPLASEISFKNSEELRKEGFYYSEIEYLSNKRINCGAVDLNRHNVNITLSSNELGFIMFYAKWCRFCEVFMPIFNEVADKVKQDFPDGGRVVMGKVDCEKETEVASRFRITKYPTLKIIRNGQLAKREYRGRRTVEALLKFVKMALEVPISEYYTAFELSLLVFNRGMIVGYFDSRDQPEYSILRRVAAYLKDDCQFHVAFGEASKQKHPPGQPIICTPDRRSSNNPYVTYNGSMNNFDEMYNWISEMCVPLVKEITFKNAEELVEEGLPFLILFHSPDDKESIKRFTEIVMSDLISEKKSINFLTANGKRFAQFLPHLGKSEREFPLIAIDSLRYMYLFPNYNDIEIPGKLKQFIKDLHSGKLHSEFHYGPEETNNVPDTPLQESTFIKLAPNRTKYTLLKDECSIEIKSNSSS